MSKYNSEEFNLKNYILEIPEAQIAVYPTNSRSESKLMILDRKQKIIKEAQFKEIHNFLPQNALIVVNNSKVFPARLKGQKVKTSGKVEFLLLTPIPLMEIKKFTNGWKYTEIKGLVRPFKRVKEGQYVQFSDHMYLHVIEKFKQGKIRAHLFWTGNLNMLLNQTGHIPLPPYIKRDDCQEDKERYQTVYASKEKIGSIAAPTAGFHFTPELFTKLKQKNIDWTSVTLYVSYGTFTPIRVQDVRKHEMHSEYIEVSQEAADKINQAKYKANPIVGVGTTTVRTLESVMGIYGTIVPYAGWTDLYVYPGFNFQVIDHMITNFHLPQSSLLLMISAFAGRKFVLESYKKAVQKGYRFFSYGDAMLIL